MKQDEETQVVRLDPSIYGATTEYAVFPTKNRAALALISFAKDLRPEDLLEILVAQDGGDRVSSINRIIELLKGMKCP